MTRQPRPAGNGRAPTARRTGTLRTTRRLGPADRTIDLAEAVRRLGVSRATLHERVRAQDPVIRGLAPRTELNPTSRWLVSLDDVEAELRRKGRLNGPQSAGEPSVDAMRVQMVQGALNEEKDRRIAALEALVTDRTPRSPGSAPNSPASAGPSKNSSPPLAAPSPP